jgi:nitrogen fixation NifU-like protein
MDLYREEILDHFKNPRNFGVVKKAKLRAKETNASCGDVMEMSLRVKGGRINEVRFQGEGCAISIAAGSMLTEMAKGRKIKEMRELTEEEMIKRLGIKVSSGRRKCVTLGLVVCQKALKKVRK